MSWDDVEALLLEFSCEPPSELREWDGSPRSWLLNALSSGTDPDLRDLGEHLFGQGSGGATDPTSLPWEPGTFKLFISHTHPNAPLAGKVRKHLARWRISAFVAHADIKPTREWENEIRAALDTCDALTALVTTDFSASDWCDQEVGWCLARQVPIVPLKIDRDPYGFFGRFQAAQSKGSTPGWTTDAIFQALAYHPDLRERMGSPIAHRYGQTTGPDGVMPNFDLLAGVAPETWTREMLEIIERGHRDNALLGEAVAPDGRSLLSAVEELLTPVRERLGLTVSVDASDSVLPSASDDDIPF